MNELQLQATIKKQQNDVELPFKILEQQHPIYLNGERCGFVDYIIRYNSKKYVVEVKNMYGKDKGTSVFWDATKVMAYSKLLNIVEGKKGKRYLPAILIPAEAVNKKNIIISVLLDIWLFSYFFDATKGYKGKVIIVDEFLKYSPYDLAILRNEYRDAQEIDHKRRITSKTEQFEEFKKGIDKLL